MLKSLELKRGNMVFNASGALKPLRNANLPLDAILVREMIQNSLDASNSDEVRIKFALHSLNSNELSGLISQNLSENKARNEILSIIAERNVTDILKLTDSGTKGLTGNLYSKLNCYGSNDSVRNNYFNLIFDITRSQTAEFSGGSYGLGKTVYFLCSEIGMVIYYSRCLNDNGEFEHRLIVSVISTGVEKTVMPPSTGILWWGSKVIETPEGEHLLALVNDEAIDFLTSYSLTPFDDSETGTKLFVVGPDKTIFSDRNIGIVPELYRNAYQWYWPRILKWGGNSLSRLAIPRIENLDEDFHLVQLGKIKEKFKTNFTNLTSNLWYLWNENNDDFILLNREVRDGDIIVAGIKNKSHGSVRSEYLTGFASIVFSEVSDKLVNKIHFLRRPGMVLFTESLNISFRRDRDCNSYVGVFEVKSEQRVEHSLYKNVDDLFKACEDPNHHSWNYRSQERFINQIVGSSLRILRDELFKFSVTENALSESYQVDLQLSRKLGQYLSFMNNIGGRGNLPQVGNRRPNNINTSRLEMLNFDLSQGVLSVTLRLVRPERITLVKYGIIEAKNAMPISNVEWEEKFKNSICPNYPIKFGNAKIVDSMNGDQIEIAESIIELTIRETLARAFVDIKLEFLILSANYLVGFKKIN